MDLAFVSFEATVFQCSACKLTYHRKETIVNHIQTKCPTATIVHGKCTLHMGPVQPATHANSLPRTPPTAEMHRQHVTGDHNLTIANNSKPTTINNHATNKQINIICVSSKEELRDLVASEESLWALFDKMDDIKKTTTTE